MAGAIDTLTGKPISELSPMELLAHLRSLPKLSETPNLDDAVRNTPGRGTGRRSDDMQGDWWGPTRRYEGWDGEPDGQSKHDPIPDNLEWHDVSSSNVRRIAYESDFHRLWIEFHSGAIYRYRDFEPSRWEDFLSSDSKGMFVWYIIRNNGTDSGAYGYEQVRPGYKSATLRKWS